MPASPNLLSHLSGLIHAVEPELIELHRALVRVPSVNNGDGSSAREDEVAAVLADWLRERGVESRTLAPEPGRASLIAEIGAGDGPTLLFMSHSDVVPVGDERAWSHPPFSGDLAEGRIWGRGANDCKMLVACQAAVLAALAGAGLPRAGRVRLIVGADEEAGGRMGFGWLAAEHPDLVRADLAICEGGGSSLGRLGGDRPLVSVGAGEKGRYEVTFTATGEGGHASTPWGRINPVGQLGRLLERIAYWLPAAAPASPVFARIAPLLGFERGIDADNLAEAMARVDRLAPGFGRSLRAQSRMTLTPTVLHAGEGSNVIPTEATLVCDSRLLPGQSPGEVDRVAAGMIVGLDGVRFSVRENAPASHCDLPEPLRQIFERAATRAAGTQVTAAPTWCTGATDAHWVRAVGTPVYGFQFITPAADAGRLGIHCIDESIEAAMLLPCAEALAHVALDYLAQG